MLQVSPLAAIFKNIATIVGLEILHRFAPVVPSAPFRNTTQRATAIAIGVIGICAIVWAIFGHSILAKYSPAMVPKLAKYQNVSQFLGPCILAAVVLPALSYVLQLMQRWFTFPLLIAIVTACVISFSPLFIMYVKEKQLVDHPQTLDLSYLYRDDGTVGLPYDSLKSRFLLAFVSTHCHFCVKAARRMHAMKVSNPELPIFMVGKKVDSADYRRFLHESQAYDIPFQMNDSLEYLKKLTDSARGLPALYWMDGNKVVRKSNYMNLNDTELATWSKQKQ
jgi:hypothetical protein